MTTHERQPKLEENLKILTVEYLSNRWSDHAQIFNLTLCDQNKVYKCIKSWQFSFCNLKLCCK